LQAAVVVNRAISVILNRRADERAVEIRVAGELYGRVRRVDDARGSRTADQFDRAGSVIINREVSGNIAGIGKSTARKIDGNRLVRSRYVQNDGLIFAAGIGQDLHHARTSFRNTVDVVYAGVQIQRAAAADGNVSAIGPGRNGLGAALAAAIHGKVSAVWRRGNRWQSVGDRLWQLNQASCDRRFTG